MNCCNVFHYAYIPGNTQHSSLLKASKVRLVTCKLEATFVTILSIKAFYFILLKLQCTFRIKKSLFPASNVLLFACNYFLILTTSEEWHPKRRISVIAGAHVAPALRWNVVMFIATDPDCSIVYPCILQAVLEKEKPF